MFNLDCNFIKYLIINKNDSNEHNVNAFLLPFRIKWYLILSDLTKYFAV